MKFKAIVLVLALPTAALANPPYTYNPPIVGIPVSPYYYSVGDQGKEARIAEEVVRQLLEARGPEAPPRMSRGAFSLIGGGAAPVLAVFRKDCVGCHKPGATKPGVPLVAADGSLFSYADPKKEAARRGRVYDSVESDAMPKKGRPLSPEAKRFIEQWAKENPQ